MAVVSVAEAKQKLTALIAAAEAGETITITRHGKPVAELKAAAVVPASNREWIEWIRRRTAHIPFSDVTGAEIIRSIRDEE